MKTVEMRLTPENDAFLEARAFPGRTRTGVSISGAVNDVIERYAALMAHGQQEYQDALTPEEIETTVHWMHGIVVDEPTSAAAHRFAEDFPELAAKLRSLSTLALAALADESERDKAMRDRERVAGIKQQRAQKRKYKQWEE